MRCAFFAAFLALLPVGCFQAAISGSPPILHAAGPAFGVYDPAGLFADDPRVEIDHIFVPWVDVDPASLYEAAAAAQKRDRALLITLEPWSWLTTVAPDQLRNDIFAGKYDWTIDRFCTVIGNLDVPVKLRWGHEMERTDGRYPWSNWQPQDYVRAYRHVVSRCRASAGNAQFVWSPLGDAGSAHYFPGHGYVDVIGLSVYGLQAYDKLVYDRNRDFNEVFGEKYWQVSDFNLPVMIAELGFNGDADYVSLWAHQVMRHDPAVPAPIAVVYFNACEVTPWPKGLGLPDWRVTSNISR